MSNQPSPGHWIYTTYGRHLGGSCGDVVYHDVENFGDDASHPATGTVCEGIENPADGKLIAVVKDLLAACEALVKHDEIWDFADPGELGKHSYYEAVIIAKAAIAKVKEPNQ